MCGFGTVSCSFLLKCCTKNKNTVVLASCREDAERLPRTRQPGVRVGTDKSISMHKVGVPLSKQASLGGGARSRGSKEESSPPPNTKALAAEITWGRKLTGCVVVAPFLLQANIVSCNHLNKSKVIIPSLSVSIA